MTVTYGSVPRVRDGKNESTSQKSKTSPNPNRSIFDIFSLEGEDEKSDNVSDVCFEQ